MEIYLRVEVDYILRKNIMVVTRINKHACVDPAFLDAIANMRRRVMRLERSNSHLERYKRENKQALEDIRRRSNFTLFIAVCSLTYQIANNDTMTFFITDPQSFWHSVSVEYTPYVCSVFGTINSVVSNFMGYF